MAAVANFTIDQGVTFSSTVTVKDSAGNALDLKLVIRQLQKIGWVMQVQEHVQI